MGRIPVVVLNEKGGKLLNTALRITAGVIFLVGEIMVWSLSNVRTAIGAFLVVLALNCSSWFERGNQATSRTEYRINVAGLILLAPGCFFLGWGLSWKIALAVLCLTAGGVDSFIPEIERFTNLGNVLLFRPRRRS